MLEDERKAKLHKRAQHAEREVQKLLKKQRRLQSRCRFYYGEWRQLINVAPCLVCGEPYPEYLGCHNPDCAAGAFEPSRSPDGNEFSHPIGDST